VHLFCLVAGRLGPRHLSLPHLRHSTLHTFLLLDSSVVSGIFRGGATCLGLNLVLKMCTTLLPRTLKLL